jgi:hypothetical protein
VSICITLPPHSAAQAVAMACNRAAQAASGHRAKNTRAFVVGADEAESMLVHPPSLVFQSGQTRPQASGEALHLVAGARTLNLRLPRPKSKLEQPKSKKLTILPKTIQKNSHLSVAIVF